jgi:hypothetical protein
MDMQTYDRSLVGRVGWKMDLYATMYMTCANDHPGEVDNTCTCLHEHAPMGDHTLRLGHAHGWTLGHGADVDVDDFATHCVTLIDWRDVLWLLVDAERMCVTVMRGGYYDRTLACQQVIRSAYRVSAVRRTASDRPRVLRKLHSLREIFPAPYCPD